MSKHTPGPWVFGILSWGEGSIQGIEEKPFDYSGPGYYDNPSIMDKNGTEIVGCGEYDVFSSPENTRLMAAAPDMLEALETIKRRMYEPRALMLEEVELMIDKVIAKARGEA